MKTKIKHMWDFEMCQECDGWGYLRFCPYGCGTEKIIPEVKMIEKNVNRVMEQVNLK